MGGEWIRDRHACLVEGSLARASSRIAFDMDAWKVRFGKQDEPGATARMFPCGGGALIVEQSARGQTRVREVTFDGRAPRRSTGIDRHLRAVESIGEALVILVDGQLVPFDPVSFAFGGGQSVDELAKELVVSPSASRCYVGARGMLNFTQIVDVRTGNSERLQFAPPSAALRIASDGGDEETWVHLPEKRIRRVRFAQDGAVAPEVIGDIEAPVLSGLERVCQFGDTVFALGGDQTKEPFPFVGGNSDARSLCRLTFGPSIGVEGKHETTNYYELLGLDDKRQLVTLGAPAKTHVYMLDTKTLSVLGSRAFPKNGMYRLAVLASPTSVFAFRRWEKLDRAYLVRRGGMKPQLRIADAKVTDETT